MKFFLDYLLPLLLAIGLMLLVLRLMPAISDWIHS
jgi:hypothetical protein